jgi:hypothetical protein
VHYRVVLQRGVLTFEKKTNSVKTSVATLTYDSALHGHWALRHDPDQGDIVFETSSTGSSWTPRGRTDATLSLTALKYELKAGTWEAETVTPGTVTFDNVRAAQRQ